LLVFVSHGDLPSNHLTGNHFPSSERLLQLVTMSSLRVEQRISTANLPSIPADWGQRVDTVERELIARHGHTRAWQLAQRQSQEIEKLLDSGSLTGELLVLRHA
jgi:hypothetical protein